LLFHQMLLYAAYCKFPKKISNHLIIINGFDRV
jgi:hypothetical protein